MSSVFRNASENFCVELILDLIFTILRWFSNVFIIFSNGLLYSWEISRPSIIFPNKSLKSFASLHSYEIIFPSSTKVILSFVNVLSVKLGFTVFEKNFLSVIFFTSRLLQKFFYAVLRVSYKNVAFLLSLRFSIDISFLNLLIRGVLVIIFAVALRISFFMEGAWLHLTFLSLAH